MSLPSSSEPADRIAALGRTVESSAGPLGLGGGLTARSSRRRLQYLGMFVAPAWVLGALARMAFPNMGMPVGGVLADIATIVGIVASVAVAVLAPRMARRHLMALGMAYATVSVVVIEAMFAMEALPSAPVRVLPWTVLVLVFFPTYLQWPVRPAAIWAALAALVPVVVVGLAARMGGPPPTVELVYHWVTACLFAAALSLVTTSLLEAARRREASALEKARDLGSYRLFDRLGQGGMGEVWRAEHRLLARPVAVKLIRPDRAPDDPQGRDGLRRRFLDEARATAELDSPHTVALFDFGVAPDGSLFYVMELLTGMTLEAAVKRGGAMSPERVVAVARQACLSLGEAHQRGLVHRDIKPANLMLCHFAMEWDFVKVLDLGIVRRVRQPQHSGETGMGSAVGTPGFMAPETTSTPAGVDRRADLYSLGCVLWYALCGRAVFEGQTPMETVVMHARDAPQPPSEVVDGVPPELDALVLRLLDKDPAKRPSSAAEVLDVLDALALPPWTDERAAAWWAEHGEHVPVEEVGSAHTWEFQTRA